jgi:uncharacterized protein YacL
MPCPISCTISLIFIIGMIYFYYMTDKSEIVKTYKEKLPSDLQKRYEKISKERMTISLYGYFYGFIISLFLIFYNLKIKKEKIPMWGMICLVMATCFITNYFYYILAPKSDYILNHTNSPEQVKAWLQMYREMQYNYHMGIVLGIVGVGILTFAFHWRGLNP